MGSEKIEKSPIVKGSCSAKEMWEARRFVTSRSCTPITIRIRPAS